MTNRGISYYFNTTGLGRFKRLALDSGGDTTPVYPPIHFTAGAAPTATGVKGDIYFDSTANALMQYTGSAWEEVGAGVTPTSYGSTSAMTAGTGITTGTGTVYQSRVYQFGNVIKTEIAVTLTGLNSGGADGDIIGVQTTANSHIGQITTAVNGLIFRGQMSCIVAPLTGEPDIDLYSATVATGTEDVGIGTLTETALLNTGADWVPGLSKLTVLAPPPNDYLYLVASGGVTDATYTAGQLMIEFWGYTAS